MNNRRKLMLVFAGTLFAGFVTGGAALANLSPGNNSAGEDNQLQAVSEEENTGNCASTWKTAGESAAYSVYEPYGLMYDQENQCFIYNGNAVRFFNDREAGASFTNFYSGIVDIEAQRNKDNELIGIKECSKEVYKQHTQKYAYMNFGAGMTDTAQEEGTSSERLLKAYAAEDIIYNKQDGGWYYNNKRIQILLDNEAPLIYVDEKTDGICVSITRNNGKISGIKEISKADAQAILESGSSAVDGTNDTMEE